jgi:hypothetical protein
MSLRETLQLKRINTMRARRFKAERKAICQCAVCRAQRGDAQLGSPLDDLFRALGAKLEDDDSTPPVGGKAH